MIGLTLASAPLHAADPDVDALLARLPRPAPDSTSFVEVRYSSLLEKPIVVSGRLEHREDGSLVRRVEWPYQEVTVLQGENVSVERAGSKPRRFTLDRAPELRGMLASFGAILQGDRQTARSILRRHRAGFRFPLGDHADAARRQAQTASVPDRRRRD